MTELTQRILEKISGILGSDRLSEVIIYLDQNPISGGKRLEVGDAIIEAPWDAHVVFVDLKPGVNWGHDCCYMAIRRDGDEIIQVAAHMPPFLKAQPSTFRLIWRGPKASEWAVSTDSD